MLNQAWMHTKKREVVYHLYKDDGLTKEMCMMKRTKNRTFRASHKQV